jgi:IS6 family transposase
MKLIFKLRHYQADIILFALRWYVSTPLTYRQLANLLNERRLSINHTTIMRWVQRLGPELSKRCRPFLKTTNSSFRCDEIYIKVIGYY